MHAALKAWRKEVQAQMPQRNPGYDATCAGEYLSRKTVAPTRAPGSARGEGDASTAGKKKTGRAKRAEPASVGPSTRWRSQLLNRRCSAEPMQMKPLMGTDER
jgi:hypothetical protein